MTSILKRVGIERPYLVKENAFYLAWLLKMRNNLLWNVTHFQLIEILFLMIQNVDKKFSFIMECKVYDISCVCITNICIVFRAREELVKSISPP